MKTILEAALFYYKRGYPVFPFRKDRTKACVKWEHLQNSMPSLDDVKGWFTKRFSTDFIALATGKFSNLLVVDCDSEQAYNGISEYIPESLVTPIAKTSRGYHIYFQHRDGLINDSNYLDKVDVRTNGGCIIAPPSSDGNGRTYTWLPGLSIEKVQPAPMPDTLFDLLMQSNNNILSLGFTTTSNSNDHASACRLTTNDNIDNKRQHFFMQGSRDKDIFHAANCLVKGKCEPEFAYKILEILAKNCDPPFDEKLIKDKIESALKRREKKERNLTADIREWVLTTTGNFLTTSVYIGQHLTTREEKKTACVILRRLADEKIIEKAGTRDGEWRLVDQSCQPMDWINADCSYKELWLPLGLGDVCGVQPGNILIFAGAKDAGKTAFLLNIAKENRYRYKVHYFNSEMGAAEFKLRASKFDDISTDQWKDVSVYERSSNFSDVVKPGEGNLNIIDYLEAPDEVYKIGGMIRKIHDRLNGAMCIIGLQKKIGQDLGRGAEFSMEKARLYISLEYGKAKIISCKNFKENELIQGNPRGYQCEYKLVAGCRIIKQAPGWMSPVERVGKK